MNSIANIEICPWCGGSVRAEHLEKHKSARCPKAPSSVLATRVSMPSKSTRRRIKISGKNKPATEYDFSERAAYRKGLRYAAAQRDAMSD
jgi:hypothetical protein